MQQPFTDCNHRALCGGDIVVTEHYPQAVVCGFLVTESDVLVLVTNGDATIWVNPKKVYKTLDTGLADPEILKVQQLQLKFLPSPDLTQFTQSPLQYIDPSGNLLRIVKIEQNSSGIVFFSNSQKHTITELLTYQRVFLDEVDIETASLTMFKYQGHRINISDVVYSRDSEYVETSTIVGLSFNRHGTPQVYNQYAQSTPLHVLDLNKTRSPSDSSLRMQINLGEVIDVPRVFPTKLFYNTETNKLYKCTDIECALGASPRLTLVNITNVDRTEYLCLDEGNYSCWKVVDFIEPNDKILKEFPLISQGKDGAITILPKRPLASDIQEPTVVDAHHNTSSKCPDHIYSMIVNYLRAHGCKTKEELCNVFSTEQAEHILFALKDLISKDLVIFYGDTVGIPTTRPYDDGTTSTQNHRLSFEDFLTTLTEHKTVTANNLDRMWHLYNFIADTGPSSVPHLSSNGGWTGTASMARRLLNIMVDAELLIKFRTNRGYHYNVRD